MGITVFKFSFGELYHRIYSWKFSFTAMCKRSRKTRFPTYIRRNTSYIRRYTSPNENFEYGFPHFNAQLTFSFKKTVKIYYVAPTSKRLPAAYIHLLTNEKAALHNDVEFATVYHRIYCGKFITFSNQMWRCICK